MYRITTIAAFGLFAGMLASAGQIQIGGVNGLTDAYITNPNANGCAGGVGACATGSTGAFTEQNYDNVLFAGAENGSTAPKPYATYDQTTGEAGTLTDTAHNETFSMVDDGATSGASNNFWAAPETGCPSACAGPSIVIPIGVFGVSDVWTMLNTELSGPGVKATTFDFTFGTTSSGGTTQTVVVKLTDSGASTTPSGMLQNAVDCVPPSNCPTLASGPTLAGSIVSSVDVLTGNLYTSLYNNGPLGSYAGSSGNIVLDDQGFLFGNIALGTLGAGVTNANSYLVSVTVMESGAANGVSPALSAITIDTVPEPSTILMFLSGLGALGFARFRRK
jgi:hypothetical protein